MTATPPITLHGIKDNQQGMDAQAVAQTIINLSHTIYAPLFELQTLEVVRVIKAE